MEAWQHAPSISACARTPVRHARPASAPSVLPCRAGRALRSAGARPHPPPPSLPPAPFREAPAYSNRRRRPPATLAAPRVLLRSNSDNNLAAGAPDWAVCPAASHRSLSPQLLQQMPGTADGAVRTLGGYVPGPRSRSPSLNRLAGAGEDGKRPQQPWHVG